MEIIFGNKKVEYLGMGKEILGQGFDDLDWIGIFEKAPKGANFTELVPYFGDKQDGMIFKYFFRRYSWSF